MRTRRLVVRWLVVGAVLTTSVAGIVVSRGHREQISDAQFAALSQREQNLAVYDAFCEQLRAHYYDPKLLKTPEWRARLVEWREKAATAPDAFHLFSDVFYQLKQKFPHSHIEVLTPRMPTSSDAAVPQDDRGRALMAQGPGFEGAQLRRSNGWAVVVGDVIAGSPADKAGIEPGWQFLSGGSERIGDSVHFKGKFLRLDGVQAQELERTLNITLVGLKTIEEGKEEAAARTVKIEYDHELMPPILPFETRALPGGVTYLRFDSFEDTATIDRVLASIDAAGTAGLIVDLRHNHGGKWVELVRVLGRLLGNDAYIGTMRTGSWWKNQRTAKTGPSYKGPLAVLIGPTSASAAEIAAAAVLDDKRGTLIGRMTSGMVLSANFYPLPGGWQVMVPELDYVRGGDRRIEGVGVEPDIRVMPTLAEIRAGRDPVVERAVAVLQAPLPATAAAAGVADEIGAFLRAP